MVKDGGERDKKKKNGEGKKLRGAKNREQPEGCGEVYGGAEAGRERMRSVV